MGDSDGEESESSRKDADRCVVLYRCCNKEYNSVKCQQCKSRFHLSCAKRLAYVKLGRDGKAANCCGGNPVECDGSAGLQRSTSETGSNRQSLKTENDVLKAENLLLRQLVEEMKDKNMILKENKVLLEAKVVALEQTLVRGNTDRQTSKPNPTLPSAITYASATGGGTATKNNKNTKGEGNTKHSKNENSKGMTGHPGDPKASSMGLEHGGARDGANLSGNLARIQERVMADVIHLEKDLGRVSSDPEANKNVGRRAVVVEDSFGLQRHQKKRVKKRLGTHEQSPEENSSGFSGGDRKVWLYVYRVRRHVTPNIIMEYIKKKPEFISLEVGVRELPSDPNKLKCFVVTAPLSLKDKMYDSDFWPQNVGVRRFDFNKHRDFLQTAGDFL